VHGIGDRLKAWRVSSGATQKEAATQLRVPVRTYQDYERSLRLPGAEAMEAFARAGINANWLLTDEGPMLIGDVGPKASGNNVDTELLARLLEMVQEIEDRRGTTVPPQSKARVVTILYDLCIRLDKLGKLDSASIEALIDLAA